MLVGAATYNGGAAYSTNDMADWGLIVLDVNLGDDCKRTMEVRDIRLWLNAMECDDTKSFLACGFVCIYLCCLSLVCAYLHEAATQARIARSALWRERMIVLGHVCATASLFPVSTCHLSYTDFIFFDDCLAARLY